MGTQVVCEHGVVAEGLVGGDDHGVALRHVDAQGRHLRRKGLLASSKAYRTSHTHQKAAMGTA
jgi:hypothetical protein